MPTLVIDKWYGGTSKDKKFAYSNQCDYSENLDISNTTYLTLSTGGEKGALTNGLEVSHILSVNTTTSKTFFFVKGYIYEYYNTDNTPSFDLSTITGWDINRDVYNSVIIGETLYLIQDNYLGTYKIWKISTSDASSNVWGNMTLLYTSQTQTTTPNQIDIVDIDGGAIGICSGRRFEIVGTTGAIIFGETLSSKVKGITIEGNSIKVYQSNGEVRYYSKNNYSLIEKRLITISPKKVIRIGNIDYIVGGYSLDYDIGFYYMNGYDVKPVYQYDDNGKYIKYNIQDIMPVFDGKKIFLVAKTKDYKSCIVSIGPIKPGFVDSYNIISTGIKEEGNYDINTNVEYYKYIRVIHSQYGILYLGISNNKGEGIAKYNMKNYSKKSPDGIYLSNLFDFGTIKNKSIKEIRIKGRFGGSSTFGIYYDESSTHIIDNVYIQNNTLNNMVRIDGGELGLDNITNIQIEWKTSIPFATQTADRLYGIEIDYDIINE